jgi:hypothetical protein
MLNRRLRDQIQTCLIYFCGKNVAQFVQFTDKRALHWQNLVHINYIIAYIIIRRRYLYNMYIVYRLFKYCFPSSISVSVLGQAVTPSTQADIDGIARDLGVKYNVLNNLVITPAHIAYLRENQLPPPPPLFRAQITLTNNDNTATLLGTNDWEIYFCHIYMIEPDFFDVATSQYQGGGIIITDSKVQISFVKGCLFKLVPATGFVPLQPGQNMSITFRGQYWSVSRTDKMPNWYVTSGSNIPKTIASTAGNGLSFVGLHDNFAKWKRVTPDDNYNPLTAEQRWIMNNLTGDMGTYGKLVLPTPKEIRVTHKDGVALDTSWVIYDKSNTLADEATYLSSMYCLFIIINLFYVRIGPKAFPVDGNCLLFVCPQYITVLICYLRYIGRLSSRPAPLTSLLC